MLPKILEVHLTGTIKLRGNLGIWHFFLEHFQVLLSFFLWFNGPTFLAEDRDFTANLEHLLPDLRNNFSSYQILGTRSLRTGTQEQSLFWLEPRNNLSSYCNSGTSFLLAGPREQFIFLLEPRINFSSYWNLRLFSSYWNWFNPSSCWNRGFFLLTGNRENILTGTIILLEHIFMTRPMEDFL